MGVDAVELEIVLEPEYRDAATVLQQQPRDVAVARQMAGLQ
jgi:hypothetical protein